MFAQIKSTGEIIDVIPQTKLTTGGSVTHYIENTLTSAPRTFQEYELVFNGLDDNKEEVPHFDIFDWQAYGRNLVKEMVVENCLPDSPFTESAIKNIIDTAKHVVTELKKVTF